MIWDCQSTLATSGQGHRFFQLINLALVMIGVYGLRSLYFALIQEARIPILYTGTAVGLISILGFTPDIFMGPWMGYLLDNNPGAEGHHKEDDR